MSLFWPNATSSWSVGGRLAFDTVSDRDVSSTASPESATQPQEEVDSDGRLLDRYIWNPVYWLVW